ncbi:MAG: hypothetical protein AB7L84_16265 [Acidimicrobiia bacterium]
MAGSRLLVLLDVWPVTAPEEPPVPPPGTVAPVPAPPAAVTLLPRPPSARADVLLAGAQQATLTVTAGDVTEDENRAQRRLATVTTVDETLIPSDMTSLLAPRGTELRLYRDDVAVGVFRVSKPKTAAKAGQTVLTVEGVDRSRQISRARWEEPYPVDAGTLLHTAIAAIVEDRAPGTPTLLNPAGYVTPSPLVFGLDSQSDPWKDLVGLATAAGMSLFFDVDGVLRLRPALEDPNPVATIVEGSGLLHAVQRDLDEEQTYNGVVVTGEAPGMAPVRAVVWDTDPLSPTYYLGPFGKVPQFYTSPLITSTEQAEAAGLEILARKLGALESVSVTCHPDATLHAGDVVRLGHAASRTDGYYIVSSLRLPLGPGPMSLTCRARRTP